MSARQELADALGLEHWDSELLAQYALREIAERDKLKEALEFYANPEIYKPHPHGPAFERRDLSFRARAALGET